MQKKEECLELKNINYQTMLYKKNKNISSNLGDEFNMDILLKNEQKNNKIQKWNKLEKTYKLEALMNFAERHEINTIKRNKLKIFLQKSLERKKLKKIKDVEFDIEKGQIIKIPNLIYNEKRGIFLLKITKKNNTCKTKKKVKKKNKSGRKKRLERKKSPKTEKKQNSKKKQSPKKKNKTNKV